MSILIKVNRPNLGQFEQMRKLSGSQKECMRLFSMSNCVFVHSFCADVKGEVVALVSPAQIAVHPPSVALKNILYYLAIKLRRNNRLGTHRNC